MAAPWSPRGGVTCLVRRRRTHSELRCGVPGPAASHEESDLWTRIRVQPGRRRSLRRSHRGRPAGGATRRCGHDLHLGTSRSASVGAPGSTFLTHGLCRSRHVSNAGRRVTRHRSRGIGIRGGVRSGRLGNRRACHRGRNWVRGRCGRRTRDRTRYRAGGGNRCRAWSGSRSGVGSRRGWARRRGRAR